MATTVSGRDDRLEAAGADRRTVFSTPHAVATDVAVAFCWIPFALVAHALAARGDLLAVFISAVLLLSFAHQPLTVALVYGDADQFRLRRALFTWSPVVFALAVLLAVQVSYVALALVGALWNAEHTLMQRYGVTRIYGRLVGQDDGRIERLVLCSWLALALLWTAADPRLPDRVAAVDLGANNRAALDLLAGLRGPATLLVPLAVAAVAVLAVLFVRAERRRAQRNAAKWLYLGSTAALFGVMLVDPLAGLMGYVGSHAVEYFVIVHGSLGRRYVRAPDGGASPLGRAVRAGGRLGFLAVYVALVVALVFGLARLGNPVLYLVVFFTLGGLHVFYDGFIWKLRRPEVARSLAVEVPVVGGTSA